MSIYLFKVEALTEIAGITANSTHVFAADKERAEQALTEMRPLAMDLRYFLAKKTPAGDYITGTDLILTLPNIAENICEELMDKGDIDNYYDSVKLTDMSFEQIDELLDMMIEYLSCEDATLDSPYYFDACEIARKIIGGYGDLRPQDLLITA